MKTLRHVTIDFGSSSFFSFLFYDARCIANNNNAKMLQGGKNGKE